MDPGRSEKKYRIFRLKAVCVIAVFFYFISNALHPAEWHFLDGVDLVIHEAGHIVFMPFGEFASFAGGTILQIAVPLVFAGYFFAKGDLFSGSLTAFWAGQSIINVSTYAGDAIAMELPLLGGGIHDWNYMLTELGILSAAPAIGEIFHAAGTAVIAAAFIAGLKSCVTAETESSATYGL